jgi:hypothetical protein
MSADRGMIGSDGPTGQVGAFEGMSNSAVDVRGHRAVIKLEQF